MADVVAQTFNELKRGSRITETNTSADSERLKLRSVIRNYGTEPGKLTAALDVLDKTDINVEYLYAFMARTEKHAYVVLRVQDNSKAEAILEQAGYHLITEADVNKL